MNEATKGYYERIGHLGADALDRGGPQLLTQLSDEMQGVATLLRRGDAREADLDDHAHGEIARLLDAAGAKIEAHSSVAPDKTTSGRRLFMAGLVAAAAAGTLAKPKEAQAQFGLFDGGISIPGLGDLIDLLLSVFALGDVVNLPPSLRRLLNQMLGSLEMLGDDSMMRLPGIFGAIENSYPSDPMRTPAERISATLNQSDRVKRRVEQAMSVLTTPAEVHADIAMEEEAIILRAQESGEAQGQTVLLQGIIAVLGSTNEHLRILHLQQSAQGQLLADLLLERASDKEQGALAQEDFIGEAANGGAGATVRPAR